MRATNLFASRLRALIVAGIFAFATFAVSITPIAGPITGPLGLAPKTAQAAYCASDPSLTGRLTASSASTTAVSRITNGTVYGYISNVDAAWSCTLYYRYSGIAYNTTPTLGTFDYGALIHSTSVSCNWVVGSTDYLKANDTADCADTDAEYAMPVTLSQEGSYINSIVHSATGNFSFVHSDCATTTFYGTSGEAIATGQTFSTAITANRPGANCDPIDIESTGVAQSFVYDHTAPTLDFTTPNEATTTYRNTTATYTVTTVITEAVAGFGGTNLWRLQRQIATITAPGTCGTFANDAATGNVTTGTSTGTINTSQTLVAAKCYRWLLNATDQNGNVASTDTSGTVLIDTVAPTTDFGAPNENTTTTQGATTFSVSWTETEADSGVNTRSLQRQKVAVTGGACGTSWANDGSAVTTGTPVSVTGLATGNCYRWNETLTDRATNTSTKTSGTVLVDSANPTVTFTAPLTGSSTIQSGTSYVVGWTEINGGFTVTARSLQRQKAAVVTSGSCANLTFANDGTPVTTGSSVTSSGLVGGNCYRWVETITVSTGKQGSSTSGTALVDTTSPTGSISVPVANAPLAGAVTITGTATDAHSFKNYILDYGVGAAPSSWTTIATVTSQVTANMLSSWTTSSLAAGVYTLRLTVNDNAAHATSASVLVYVDNTRRGDETYWTSVPFDLGGGYALGVGVANGEATLDRNLFSIPSYGPSQALSLHYSSQETTNTGRFGYGWISNLSQYLTFENGFVVWHEADGGRVPFGSIGSTWTPLAGHYEVMGTGTGVYTITLKDQTKLTFENSGAGRLTKIENRFSKALTIVWNTGSATVTDASARVTNLVLDGSGRITDATDSAGRHWGFRFNASGDMDQITDPAANLTTLAYTSHALASVTRIRSRVSGPDETIIWSIGYTSGKATSVTDPVNATVSNTFTYNSGSTVAGLLKTYSPVARNGTTYAYDALGRVTSTTDPDGYVTTSGFDTSSNLLTIVRPIDLAGTVQGSTYTYDARGNLLTDVSDLDAATTVKTVKTYNATNDLLSRSDADTDLGVHAVTLNTYDAAGHLMSVDVNCTNTGTAPPASGTTCTGAGTQDASTNLFTAYSYTSNDQRLTETDPLGHVTKHVYDPNGDETSVIANCTTSGTTPPAPPSSCTGAGTHDAQTNAVTTEAYDTTSAGKAGLVTTATDGVAAATTYAYDALGRQTSEVLPGDPGSTPSIPALTHTTTYDQFGNVLTQTDNWPGLTTVNQTTHVYDLANREKTTIDPALAETDTNFDAAGEVISTTAVGITTTKTYDGRGNAVTEITGADTTSHAWDGQSREVETIDPTEQTTDKVYDLGGRIVSETVQGADPLTTQHTYDALGRELTATDPQSAVTSSTYDRSARLISRSVGGSRTDTAYDRDGNSISVTGPYPAAGPAAPLTTSVYDPLNRAIQTIANDVATPTLPTEDVTTTTYYDAAGHTLAVKDPKGITTRSILNARGLVAQSIADCTDTGMTPPSNPAACTGGGTPDTTTNVVTTTTYDGSGAVIVSLVDHGDGTSATTTVANDAAGRQIAVKDAIMPRGTVSMTFYDPAGRVASTVVNCTDDTNSPQPPDPALSWWACHGTGVHDGTWNLTTTYAYDPATGNKINETAPNDRVTTFAYDGANRLISQTENYTAGTPNDDQNLTTYFAYDDAGRQTAVRKPTDDRAMFSVTRTFYDDAGRVSKVIDNCTNSGTASPPDPDWQTCIGPGAGGTQDGSTNITTTDTYDAQGNKLTETAPDPSAAVANGAAMITTQYAYDDHNRLCRVVQDAMGATNLQTLGHPCTDATQGTGTTTQNVSTTYAYDGSGNLVSMLDADGHTTTYTYDGNGQMASLTDGLGTSTSTLSWVYDALGRKVSQNNRTDSAPLAPEVTWTYDGAGRMLTRSADAANTTYVYDLNGNRTTATSAGGTISATYDRLNRPLAISLSSDSGAGTTYTYSFTNPSWTDPTGSYAATLDMFGRELTLTDPIHGASTFGWVYFADGQPESTSAPNANTTAYTYDPVGRGLTNVVTGPGSVNRASDAWTHNAAGQATSENSIIAGDSTNGTTTLAYDPLARLTSYIPAVGSTKTYGWDNVPNRTSVQTGAATPISYAYDAANRLTSDSVPNSYTYDVDGRLTVRPGQRLEWDNLGRLTKVKPPTGNNAIATYTYDALDRLLLADYGGSNRIRFRYVGLTTFMAQEVNDQSGAAIRSIANDWIGTRLVDWTGSGSNQRFYGTNGHQDVTWLADASGAVIDMLRYDPYGNATTIGTTLPDFRYQGSFYDSNTDLSWAISRWYAGSLGTFLSEDTLLGKPTDPPSRNLYAYGAGDPIDGWDPRGTCTMAMENPFMFIGSAAECALEGTGAVAGSAVGVGSFILTLPFLVAGDTAKPIAIPKRITLRRFPSFRGCFVIGEGQGRVVEYALTHHPRCDTMWTLHRLSHRVMLSINYIWVYTEMSQLKHLYDIGPRSRSIRRLVGDYYRMEWAATLFYPFKTRIWNWNPN
jgi:RHS repeat-associated protein